MGGALSVLALAGVLGGTARAAVPGTAADPSPPIGFKLEGTHGYSISAFAVVAPGSGHGAIALTASRAHEAVSYQVAARITEGSIHADFGALGRVDLVLRPSGRDETVHVRCVRGGETFEAGTYEGLVEFTGEHGFTHARATRVSALPALPLYAEGACGERSSAESRGAGEPGARLAGISYAHRQTLKFQVNKNRPDGRTLFSASLRERRNGIRIYREVEGTAPAGAFRYDRQLRTATLGPPAPFSGSARLRRSPDAVSPLLAGNLTLAFPGHTVGLDGAGVHVSLVHARLVKGRNAGTATIGS